jgi:peptidoglycan/LPS O-acetylase OafA/YrhL
LATPIHLGRIITGGRRFIAQVDGLRFVAISAVVLFHLGTYPSSHTWASNPPAEVVLRIFGVGAFGVQLFFVLSGFLLALPFAKYRLGLAQKPALRTYYLRRLTRLEPPYVISLILIFTGACIAFGARGFALWPNLLAGLVYQHNLIFGTARAVSEVAWTLEIEVQFYMLAPLLAVIFSIRGAIARRAAILGIVFLFPVLRHLLISGHEDAWYVERLHLSLPFFIEFFIAGFFLAEVYLTDWKESPRQSRVWDIATFLGWPVLAAIVFWGRVPVLTAPLVLVVYAGAFRGRFSSWLFSRPVLTTVGGMCYSMYLLHSEVIHTVLRGLKRYLSGANYGTWLFFESAIAIPAILIVTLVFFVLLERPCMDPTWPRKAWGRVRRFANPAEVRRQEKEVSGVSADSSL